ncbi:MAG: class I tRNA ligase family protein [Bacteroidales bacterium]|nr:MAG: class I tRNA ligase family protein [Bacteroidales bacterium]
MEHLFSFSVKCPYCGKVLNDDHHMVNNKPGIRLKVQSSREEGMLWLCSVYGSYDHETELEIADKAVTLFFCPHCEKPLAGKDECEECGAPLVHLKVIEGGKVIFCSRRGCRKHYIAFENLSSTLKQFYDEYGYEHQ